MVPAERQQALWYVDDMNYFAVKALLRPSDASGCLLSLKSKVRTVRAVARFLYAN